MGKNSDKCGKSFPPPFFYKWKYLNILNFFNTYFWRVEIIYTQRRGCAVNKKCCSAAVMQWCSSVVEGIKKGIGMN